MSLLLCLHQEHVFEFGEFKSRMNQGTLLGGIASLLKVYIDNFMGSILENLTHPTNMSHPTSTAFAIPCLSQNPGQE